MSRRDAWRVNDCACASLGTQWAASLAGRQHAETQIHHAAMKAEDVPRWLLVWPEPLQVVLKCPVTYVSVPVLDVVAKKQHGVLKRANTRRFRFGCTRAKLQKKDQPRKILYMQWPILNPSQLFRNIVEAEAFSLLQSEGWSWCEFWRAAASEDFMKGHPVLQFEESRQARAVGASFHGDEGEGKRKKNLLVLSWSSLAVHGPSEKTKFPFCVPWRA